VKGDLRRLRQEPQCQQRLRKPLMGCGGRRGGRAPCGAAGGLVVGRQEARERGVWRSGPKQKVRKNMVDLRPNLLVIRHPFPGKCRSALRPCQWEQGAETIVSVRPGRRAAPGLGRVEGARGSRARGAGRGDVSD
jgi:hypothetical protein